MLLLWIPLRQRPGLGTVSNVVWSAWRWTDAGRGARTRTRSASAIPLLVAGVLLNGAATGLYISARFGPGPRDGLMTGLHLRTGRSVRLVRTGIEVAVLAAGLPARRLGRRRHRGRTRWPSARWPSSSCARFAIEGRLRRHRRRWRPVAAAHPEQAILPE